MRSTRDVLLSPACIIQFPPEAQNGTFSASFQERGAEQGLGFRYAAGEKEEKALPVVGAAWPLQASSPGMLPLPHELLPLPVALPDLGPLCASDTATKQNDTATIRLAMIDKIWGYFIFGGL